MKFRLRSSAAFSLIEILSTVAIVGTLAAIAIPMVRNVQVEALRAKNISNLRQIGLGIGAFVGENDGRFPGNYSASSDGQSNTRYPHLINPYIGGENESIVVTDPVTGQKVTIARDNKAYRSAVYHSPATPPAQYMGGGDSTWGVYGANSKVLKDKELISSVRIQSMQSPSKTVIVAEKYALAGGAVLSLTGPYPQNAAGAAANLRKDRNAAADPKGAGPCGFLFADSHVEIINLESLRPPLGAAWPGHLLFEP